MDPIGIAIALAVGSAAYVFVHHQQLMEGPDGAAISQLKIAGSDLRKPHSIDFFFLAQSQQALEAIAGELAPLGYNTSISAHGAGESLSLCASRTMVPAIRTMRRLRAAHTRLATVNHAQYDGWGAGVVSRVAGY